MDKQILTDSDINALIKASKKLKPDEIITATLETSLDKSSLGEPRTIKTVTQYVGKPAGEIINFPNTAPIVGEGIKGEAVIEAFKKGNKRKTNHQSSFSLKRTFFSALNKVISTVNDLKLNSGKIIYNCDEFGRVYINIDNKRHYLSSDKTHCITEDGYYGEIKINGDELIDLAYYDSEDAIYETGFVFFKYLYISPEAAKKGEQMIKEEEERMLQNFIEEHPVSELPHSEEPSKVIDFTSYQQNSEEPKR